MKSFKDYITKKTYDFKIKVAGELPAKFESVLKTSLEKYGVDSMTTSKTPIQKLPLDFPGLDNAEIHIFEVCLKYPVIPPVLVNPAAMEGTGFLGQAAENVYRIEKDDVYLVGTSEVPLAAMHMDEVLSGDKLPMRYAGYSSCFRREAGTYGKDTRGIIRVHQFDKVEMFSFCHPDQAKVEHARILQWEKDFLNAMEIPYRVIDVASGDLGSSANRKFDCEAWIPTQDAYREVTSTSNCTEFQARRLNIRYKDSDGTKAVATLNGTLVAIPRMIVAILENHQNADGTVNIPKALQPFLGKERFELV